MKNEFKEIEKPVNVVIPQKEIVEINKEVVIPTEKIVEVLKPV